LRVEQALLHRDELHDPVQVLGSRGRGHDERS
jgi:hypothetical protein